MASWDEFDDDSVSAASFHEDFDEVALGGDDVGLADEVQAADAPVDDEEDEVSQARPSSSPVTRNIASQMLCTFRMMMKTRMQMMTKLRWN